MTLQSKRDNSFRESFFAAVETAPAPKRKSFHCLRKKNFKEDIRASSCIFRPAEKCARPCTRTERNNVPPSSINHRDERAEREGGGGRKGTQGCEVDGKAARQNSNRLRSDTLNATYRKHLYTGVHTHTNPRVRKCAETMRAKQGYGVSRGNDNRERARERKRARARERERGGIPLAPCHGGRVIMS